MEEIKENNILSWAEKEIQLAIESEKKAAEGTNDWEYGVACYESALKAFKSLSEDEHSGASVMITKSILNRLIDGKCLTPIEESDDIWEEFYLGDETEKKYQCTRMSSLFKEVSSNGKITYSDVDRVQCIDINSPDVAWHNGFARRLIDNMFPINMPYLPSNKPFKLFEESFLVDPKHGDYDTVAYLYILMPNGQKIELNRYFKEDDDGHMIRIEKEEWDARKEASLKKGESDA